MPPTNGARGACTLFLSAIFAPTIASAQTFYGCDWGTQLTKDDISQDNKDNIVPYFDTDFGSATGLAKISAATKTAVATGAWSSTATWGGPVPANNDAVHIPAGKKVQLDQQISNAITLKSVRVDGCLEFKRSVNTRLRTKVLYVAPPDANAVPALPGGELWVGTDIPDRRIYTDKTAEIVFPNTALDSETADPQRLGNGLVAGGQVTMAGRVKVSKVRAPAGLAQGATSINFSASAIPTGWAVNDWIVITGKRYVQPAATTYTDCKNNLVTLSYKTGSSGSQDELVQITNVDTVAKIVYFDRLPGGSPDGLQHDHTPLATITGQPGWFLSTPWVINLTRNVQVRTDTLLSSYTPNALALPVDFVAHQDILDKRGHTMFMSPQTIVDGVEFQQLGRTDKSRRAAQGAACSVSNSAADAEPRNVKGRYPVHIHHVYNTYAAPLSTSVPVVRSSSVWGSPGWGYAHHDSEANFFHNVSYDTFGGAFVTESGNEKGVWFGNVAVRSSGLDELIPPKNTIFQPGGLGGGGRYVGFDTARTGHGFWLHGRLVHVTDNVAANAARSGFIFFHRETDLPGPGDGDVITGRDVLQPVSMRYFGDATSINQDLDFANIQSFVRNEAFGSFYGLEVVKADPTQPHDLRTMIDQFAAWEVSHLGVHFEYTAHYTVKDGVVVRALNPRNMPGSTGVQFGVNSYDMALVGSTVATFPVGVEFLHQTSNNNDPNLPDGYFVAVGNNFAPDVGTQCKNPTNGGSCLNSPHTEDQGDVFTSTVITPSNPPFVSFTPQWTANSPWCFHNGAAVVPCWNSVAQSVHVIGTKNDEIDLVSSLPIPFLFSTARDGSGNHDNETIIDVNAMKGIVKSEGYYKNGADDLFVVWPEYVTDRLTGNVELTTHVIGLDHRCNDAGVTGCGISGSTTNRGTLTLPTPPAPSANDDLNLPVSRTASLPVPLTVLSNDVSGVAGCANFPVNPGKACTRPTGLTAPRYGIVKWVPEFDPNSPNTLPDHVEYLPFPGIPSSVTGDSFDYWIRNSQGWADKATVTISYTP